MKIEKSMPVHKFSFKFSAKVMDRSSCSLLVNKSQVDDFFRNAKNVQLKSDSYQLR